VHTTHGLLHLSRAGMGPAEISKHATSRTRERYRPTVDSDFSVLVVLHLEGRLETFKYRGLEMICEASGSDFRDAMIHTTARGLALDEPIDNQDPSANLGVRRTQLADSLNAVPCDCEWRHIADEDRSGPR
jgi:hypothetical protein